VRILLELVFWFEYLDNENSARCTSASSNPDNPAPSTAAPGGTADPGEGEAVAVFHEIKPLSGPASSASAGCVRTAVTSARPAGGSATWWRSKLAYRSTTRSRRGNASGFTGRTTASPRVPFHPRLVRSIAHDVRKRPSDNSRRHSTSLSAPARPLRPGVGRREGGGKSVSMLAGPRWISNPSRGGALRRRTPQHREPRSWPSPRRLPSAVNIGRPRPVGIDGLALARPRRHRHPDRCEWLTAGVTELERRADWEPLLHLVSPRRAEAVTVVWCQIAMASSANATGSRRFAGSSTASS
jgi:hypothetical protein